MAVTPDKLPGSVFTVSGWNSTLTFGYTGAGQKGLSRVATANLRCNKIVLNYGVISTESHSRSRRAFYPHRRSQGGFDLTFEFVGWKEYWKGQQWFQDFCDAVLNNKQRQRPSVITITVPSYGFHRFGVLTDGITYGDHKASMVFAPTLSFISVQEMQTTDPNDPDDDSISHTTPGDALADDWFYPDSKMSKPGELATYLFNDAQTRLAGAQVTSEIASSTPPPKKKKPVPKKTPPNKGVPTGGPVRAS